MKLNEKHLAAFANGTAPIDKQGYLNKRGEVNRAFHRRWFVLKGNLLFYSEKRYDKEPIGVVILEGCTVELSETSEAFAFELVFPGSGSRTYILAGESQDEMEEWMKAIACAGYDYMKLMVSELQRQLEDLNVDKTSVASSAKPVSAAPVASEGLLVDLTVPGLDQAAPPVPPRQNIRKNPFNAEERDAFGATPFVPKVHQVIRSNQPRTFKEMHKDFGAFINKKVGEWKTSSSWQS